MCRLKTVAMPGQLARSLATAVAADASRASCVTSLPLNVLCSTGKQLPELLGFAVLPEPGQLWLLPPARPPIR